MSYEGMFTDKCNLIKVSLDKWNRSTEVVMAVNEPCRFEYGHRIIQGAEGEDINGTATVFFRVNTVIEENYLIQFSGRKYKVVDIQRPRDSVAEHHVEVLVK